MRRVNLVWDKDNLEHLWHSHSSPDEVDEALFGLEEEETYCLEFRDGDYHVFLGENGDGRLLAMAGEYLNHGTLRIFSARNMNAREKRRFRKR